MTLALAIVGIFEDVLNLKVGHMTLITPFQDGLSPAGWGMLR